ncbi:phytoene/squalene synthase family protein [Arcticibacterium luteifluviistationis]|uniref:Phytoene synthase n=1 Tax=Arcticibacterium luteifluviistationis TaxID=1784714 RepID=A0A2Z4GDB4_9BACT|nr:phytoene/squalene synthase family protein [Arcticibacterium luteifluviistationis]AWV99015.1 phytoene synthase [Arcticibacterium luteifluviistationis]
MKQLFDELSLQSSKLVTKKYSTSFSLAVGLLSPTIRPAIYNIYGFVRLADEIVDSFHDYPKEDLFNRFEEDYYHAIKDGISLNPILNAFQKTVKEYDIDPEHVAAFMNSMRADLEKQKYETRKEIDTYIYGSADVVGLMCLKVFVKGDHEKYSLLKDSAMSLGSAFQKVNFLRDLKDDYEILNRSYFPNIDLRNITQSQKEEIVREIKSDFEKAYSGIVKLPLEARMGVYVAYRYYNRLLYKLEKTPSENIMNERIRVSDLRKLAILGDCYIRFRLNRY